MFQKIAKLDYSRLFFHMAQLVLYIIAANLVLASVLFLLGRSISWWTLPVSFALAMGVLSYFYGDDDKRMLLPECILTLLCMIAFTMVIGRFYDISWDGNAYHKVAIGMLENGWNPVRELPEDAWAQADESFSGALIYCEAYCKVTWIFAASVYALTGNIESGKVYGILAIAVAFGLALYFLRKKGYQNLPSIGIAACIALNPIAVQQMLTYYMDGFLHTMLAILIIGLLMLSDKERFDAKVSASIVACAMLICGNVKFTGLLYGGIFCIAFYLWNCITERKWFLSGVRYAALAITTVCVCGFNPYVTNVMRHGSITYPLTGAGKRDIMSGNSPFEEQNHFRNVILSLFSKMDNYQNGSRHEAYLKLPFTIDWSYERPYLDIPDARLSGFGMLFSGALVLALIVLVIYLIRGKKNRTYAMVVMNLVVCLALTFGIKESWWARYAPYIYFIPMIGLLVAAKSEKRLMRGVGAVLAITLLLNSGLYVLPMKNLYARSMFINSYLEQMRSNDMMEVANKDFEGVYYNLKDKDILYIVNNEVWDDEDALRMEYQGTRYRYVSE